MENLDQAMAEIERLRKDGEKLHGELSGDTFKLAEHEYNVLKYFCSSSRKCERL